MYWETDRLMGRMQLTSIEAVRVVIDSCLLRNRSTTSERGHFSYNLA